ncbi:MAG: cytochrome c maturation protein CcmE [bacterium JZ-2024 1]
MRETRLYVLTLVGFALLVALIFSATRSTAVYYYELAQAAEEKPDREVRIGAQVVPESITFDPEHFLLTFSIYDPKKPEIRLKVAHKGPRPDNLMDDVMVLVRGKVDWQQGVITTRGADGLLVKCPSRYEPPK